MKAFVEQYGQKDDGKIGIVEVRAVFSRYSLNNWPSFCSHIQLRYDMARPFREAYVA